MLVVVSSKGKGLVVVVALFSKGELITVTEPTVSKEAIEDHYRGQIVPNEKMGGLPEENEPAVIYAKAVIVGDLNDHPELDTFLGSDLA